MNLFIIVRTVMGAYNIGMRSIVTSAGSRLNHRLRKVSAAAYSTVILYLVWTGQL